VKAFVAETETAAKRNLQALGLPLSEWMPIGWGDPCTGHRFEKVIAVEPKGDGWTEQHVMFFNEVLCTRAGGKSNVHFL
jgi:hypothetical protein